MRARGAPERRPGRATSCCSRRAPRTSTRTSTSRSATSSSARQRSTGTTTPRPKQHCDRRRIVLPRGRVLGGSSSINAMVYIRGNPLDYDAWGVPGWSWAELLPYFIKAEDNERGASPFHGAGGPLPVSEERSHNRISHAFVEAGVQAGLAGNEDFNDGDQDGVGMYQVTQRGGMRASHGGRLPAPGLRAAEPRGDALHAGAPHPVRGHAGGRRRSVPARPAEGVPRRARGAPRGGRVQLAAAADALRARRARAPDDARNRGAARPARDR